MSKIFIHKEQVTVAGTKKMFQITLPSKAVAITGVFVRASKLYLPSQELPNVLGNNRDCGSINMELAGNGNMIYAQDVAISHHEAKKYTPLIQAGINENLGAWFQGEASEMQSLNAPIEKPIIECFYTDSQVGQNYPYEVIIYLELDETTDCQ